MNNEINFIETGRDYINQKEYKLAEELFKKAVQLNSKNEYAYFELGKIYYIEEKFADAIENLKKSLMLNQNNIFAYLLLAKTYKAKGLYQESIEEFKKTLDLGYQEENIHKELSDIYKILNNFNLSIDELKKALDNGYDEKLYQADLDSLFEQQIRLVQSYNFAGRYSQAIKEADNVSRLIPKENLRLQNILHNEAEIAQKKISLTSKIRSITITLTNKCNLACLMCQTRNTPWDLPQKVVQEIISIFPYLERIMLQGGEVFLYDGFRELLQEANKFPIRKIIATNGLLIDEEAAELIVRSNVELTFSIDGATKEVYEHIRRGAVFEKVIEKVNLINELRERLNPKMETRLNVLVMRANYHQLEYFLDFAKQYKFNNLFFNSAGCDFKNLEENVFYYNRDKDILDYLNKIRNRLAERAKAYGVRLENWLPSLYFFNAAQANDEQKNSKGIATSKQEDFAVDDKLFCHAPWQRLYVDCGGNVRPDCLCLTDNYIGNILDSNLEELWNCEKLKEYRRKIVNRNYHNFCDPACVHGRVPEKNLKYV